MRSGIRLIRYVCRYAYRSSKASCQHFLSMKKKSIKFIFISTLFFFLHSVNFLNPFIFIARSENRFIDAAMSMPFFFNAFDAGSNRASKASLLAWIFRPFHKWVKKRNRGTNFWRFWLWLSNSHVKWIPAQRPTPKSLRPLLDYSERVFVWKERFPNDKFFDHWYPWAKKNVESSRASTI